MERAANHQSNLNDQRTISQFGEPPVTTNRETMKEELTVENGHSTSNNSSNNNSTHSNNDSNKIEFESYEDDKRLICDTTHSFIASWVNNSYGIRETPLQETVTSLVDVPSADRRSTDLLIGTSLQSMILGTSLLSVPYCVRVAGIWGVALIVVIGSLTNFTASILSGCQYQTSRREGMEEKRVHTTFVEMCHACFNRGGKIVMEVLVYLSLLRNVVVLILLSDLTHEILGKLGVTAYDRNLLPVFWTVAVMPFLFVSRISNLAWVTFFGMLLYLASILVMFGLFFRQASLWDIRDIPLDFDVQGVGISAGIIINSYAVHMNMPSLEGSMKHPSHYVPTTSLSFVFNLLVKLAFAICGYLTYGVSTQSEITSNLNMWHPLPSVLKACLLFFAYFTIPLQSHVVFELIDLKLKGRIALLQRVKFVWTLLSRLLLMTLCLLFALIVPHFGLVISLIGSVRGSLIALVLPALFYTNLKNNPKTSVKRIVCYFTVVFGILVGLLGLYSSVTALLFGVNKRT